MTYHYAHFCKPDWNCVHFVSERESESLQQDLEAVGMPVLKVDMGAVKSKEALLKEVAAAMDFPDYFGSNWDALNDCLSDMSWKPSRGYLLFVAGADLLWKNAVFSAGTFVAIWQSAAKFWSRDDVPFHLIFVLSRDAK